jgi:hypothetical protein
LRRFGPLTRSQLPELAVKDVEADRIPVHLKGLCRNHLAPPGVMHHEASGRLRPPFGLTSTSLRAYFDLPSGLLRPPFGFTSTSLRVCFDLPSGLLRHPFELTSTSLRAYFDLPSSLLRPPFGFASTSLRAYFDLPSGPHPVPLWPLGTIYEPPQGSPQIRSLTFPPHRLRLLSCPLVAWGFAAICRLTQAG